MDPTRIATTTAVLGVAALLTACASGLARQDEGAQFRYQDYAGAPVDTIDTMGRVSGWNSVSRDQLVLWTGVNEAWLIKVWSTCRDLGFANTVAVKRSGVKITRFDQVLVGEERCQISEIRPVDVKQMKADRAAAKAKP
ncbi:MAG: hypothetical protein EBS39_05960 [Gammaproteobacteria bacterium]|nr:hypothetical protein [Gammaproteobacteria bacterium]